MENKVLQKECLEKIENLSKNLIIGFSELNIGEYLSSGSYSIVLKGTYKFLPVALKKITLQRLTVK